ncbi:hypothetical protein Tamer19_45750 [Cupriavidus sp. TA19]|nr:hypothetical protein Tamer19_45750 [Cupriavidus sp. TA19]
MCCVAAEPSNGRAIYGTAKMEYSVMVTRWHGRGRARIYLTPEEGMIDGGIYPYP